MMTNQGTAALLAAAVALVIYPAITASADTTCAAAMAALPPGNRAVDA